MDSKTITIDQEAYNILRSHRFGNESFSDVIKKEMALAAYWDKACALEREFAERRESRRINPTQPKRKRRKNAPAR
jgi:predicted CopG family antitoxin